MEEITVETILNLDANEVFAYTAIHGIKVINAAPNDKQESRAFREANKFFKDYLGRMCLEDAGITLNDDRLLHRHLHAVDPEAALKQTELGLQVREVLLYDRIAAA